MLHPVGRVRTNIDFSHILPVERDVAHVTFMLSLCICKFDYDHYRHSLNLILTKLARFPQTTLSFKHFIHISVLLSNFASTVKQFTFANLFVWKLLSFCHPPRRGKRFHPVSHFQDHPSHAICFCLRIFLFFSEAILHFHFPRTLPQANVWKFANLHTSGHEDNINASYCRSHITVGKKVFALTVSIYTMFLTWLTRHDVNDVNFQ